MGRVKELLIMRDDANASGRSSRIALSGSITDTVVDVLSDNGFSQSDAKKIASDIIRSYGRSSKAVDVARDTLP